MDCRALSWGRGWPEGPGVGNPVSFADSSSQRRSFWNLLYKGVIQHADGVGKILVVNTEDDVQFVGTLVDHTDVDIRLTKGGEQLTGNTGAVCHTAAHSGDDSDLVMDFQRIGLAVCLNFA